MATTRGHNKEIVRMTLEIKKRTSWNKGLHYKRPPFSLEWRQHLSDAKKNFIPWNKGKKLHYSVWNKGKVGIYSEEYKRKLSESHSGSKHYGWKGGNENLTKRIRFSGKYKKWRADVFRRDGWSCQTCGLRGHGRDIEAHHIIPMKELLVKVQIKGLSIDDKYILAMAINELFDINNGVTLCKKCHILTFKQGETNE
jgi:predicted HNH restriction endonuclease